jgi:hypothetical protein
MLDGCEPAIARHLRLGLVFLGALLAPGVGTATGHGLADQVWDACTNFAYAPDACDCDTGDPDVCCMGQEFTPNASILNGVDLYLRRTPDGDGNAPFSTFVTVNVQMGAVTGPLLGRAGDGAVSGKWKVPQSFHFPDAAPIAAGYLVKLAGSASR